MTRTPHARTGAFVATASIAVLLVSGCTRADTAGGPGADGTSPGITDDSISIGISSPLSGPTAGPGSCTVAGLASYIGAKNADGGFEFGDGKTRQVEFTYLDDVYDPAKAVSNFRQLVNDGVFAYVGPSGRRPTPPSCRSPRRRRCRRCCSPPRRHVLRGPGRPPLDPGLPADLRHRGPRLRPAAGRRRPPITVATLAQNDDFGESYLQGFDDAIQGSQVQVVGSATYEPTDTTLDSQVTELAATKADVLLSAVSVTPRRSAC